MCVEVLVINSYFVQSGAKKILLVVFSGNKVELLAVIFVNNTMKAVDPHV